MPSVKRIRVDEKVEDANGDIVGGHPGARSRLSKPLVYSGSLDTFAHQDVTPAIGREFEGLQITDLLRWGDDMIRDLAITGTIESPVQRDWKLICVSSLATRSRLLAEPGRYAGANEGSDTAHHRALRLCTSSRFERALTQPRLKLHQPSSSDLHVHPLTEEGSELGDQISVISSEKQKKGGGLTHQLSDVSRLASAGWHSDISFEPVPSDYAMLKIHTLPATGGDTLWASGYEVYDRLSPAMQTFLEGLTATHDAKFFLEEAARLGEPIRKSIRGNPLNFGEGLTATHPVIRTNRKHPSRDFVNAR
jgi:hypothetical protein